MKGARERPGSDLTITLDGAALQAASQRTVSLFGPGYTLEVDDITLGPGQQDTVIVKAMGSSIVYTTQQRKTPLLLMGIQTASDDYLFEIRVCGDTSGQSVHLVLDHVAGKLKVQVDGPDTADYRIDLLMHHIGACEDGSLAHIEDHAINVASGGSVSITYGLWKCDGGAPALEVDGRKDTTAGWLG